MPVTIYWLLGGCALVGGAVIAIFLVRKSSGGGVAGRWGRGVKVRGDDLLAVREKKAKKKPRKRPGASGAAGGSFLVRLARPMGFLWRAGNTSQSRVQELLVHAGIRQKGAVEVFLGAKLALALALPVATLAGMLWWCRSSGKEFVPRDAFMYATMALIVGLMLPTMWLRRKARGRIERVKMSLPDALDLLIVCIEAGLGLDAALVRLSQEMAEAAPELCEELMLLNLEVSAGKERSESLRNFALRTGCVEVESLAARMNQAAKYGTNLGHSLRIHSDSLRQKRRQEAEERAAKTTVKLLFPLVFFIFPALFVVVLGPGAVQVYEMMHPPEKEAAQED